MASVDTGSWAAEIRQHHLNEEVPGWKIALVAFGNDSSTPRRVVLTRLHESGRSQSLDLTEIGVRRGVQLASAPNDSFDRDAFEEWFENVRHLPDVKTLALRLPPETFFVASHRPSA